MKHLIFILMVMLVLIVFSLSFVGCGGGGDDGLTSHDRSATREAPSIQMRSTLQAAWAVQTAEASTNRNGRP